MVALGERTNSERELGSALFGENGPLDSNVKVIRYVTTEGLNEEVLQSYTCLHEEDSGHLFVNIGTNTVRGFKQSTYMNAIKLGEIKGASKVYFIVARDNPDKTEYRRAFQLLDLKRVSSEEKKTLFKSEVDYLVYARVAS